jgi:hypothetical protein
MSGGSLRKNKVLLLFLAAWAFLPATSFADRSGELPYVVGARADKEVIYPLGFEETWTILEKAARNVSEEVLKKELKVPLSSLEVYADRYNGLIVFFESRRKGSGPRDLRNCSVLTFHVEPEGDRQTKVTYHVMFRQFRLDQPGWGFSWSGKNRILEQAEGMIKGSSVEK